MLNTNKLISHTTNLYRPHRNSSLLLNLLQLLDERKNHELTNEFIVHIYKLIKLCYMRHTVRKSIVLASILFGVGTACGQSNAVVVGVWKLSKEYFYDQATTLNNKQQYSKAIELYKLAAENGYAPAQNDLGVCYIAGEGVQPDYSQATMWFSKAAEQNFAAAQYNLGFCYYNGYGVKEDFTLAVEYFRKAAEQNYPAALYDLGICYILGQGVTKDYSEALKLWSLAAENGYNLSQYDVGLHYYNGESVAKNYQKAIKTWKLSAMQGDSTAQQVLHCLNVNLQP